MKICDNRKKNTSNKLKSIKLIFLNYAIITFYIILFSNTAKIMDERYNKLHLNMKSSESASKCFSYHDLRRLK